MKLDLSTSNSLFKALEICLSKCFVRGSRLHERSSLSLKNKFICGKTSSSRFFSAVIVFDMRNILYRTRFKKTYLKKFTES
jgi:hypothetical protein